MPTKPKLKRPPKPPTALFLITEPDERLHGKQLRAGMFENPKPDEILAYDPNDIVYYKLSTKNSRYLEFDRLWPVRPNPSSALERDEMWGGWRFGLVELGAPLMLESPATWQALLDGGVRLKPKKKDHPSLLRWPAIKGHVEALRILLAAGADPGREDVVCAAAAFRQRATARLLVEAGLDGKAAVVSMTRYQNQEALEILRDLGFS